MNIIILGDKFQKRMKSRGCVGLFKIGNDYLIIKQYKVLKKLYPDAKIIYVYGFEHKKFLNIIKQYSDVLEDIELVYNPNYELYNYGASLQLVKDRIKNDTIITFGDTIIDRRLFAQFDIGKRFSQIIVSHNNKNKLGCIISSLKIQNLFYDLDNKIEEVFYFTKQDAKTLQKFLENNNLSIKNMFIFEIINKLIDMKMDIRPLIQNTKYKISKMKRKNVI
jgi:CTP:phosphocholine cytidylyltransferase-like protein